MSHKNQDIVETGFIAKLPQAARPYAILMRLDRPIGWWLLLIPGLWGIMLAGNGVAGLYGRDYYLMTLFLIGAIVMRGAGCIINDMWDRDIDKKVERTKMRPLASGQVSLVSAGGLLFFLLFIGFIILVQTSYTAIWLGVLSLVFIGIYPLMKRITWWPQAFLGLTFNFGALMGFAAAADRIGIEPFLLYVSAIFWTIAYDTVYAHQDKEDDALIGIKSTALLFGSYSFLWVCVFYALSLIMMAATLFYAGAGWLSIGLLVLPAAYLIYRLTQWNTYDPESALEFFKANRNYGLLMLIPIAAHSLWI